MRGLLPLTDVEYDAIVKAFGGRMAVRNRTLFIFGCHTGFRIREILALKTKDVITGNHPRSVVEVTASSMKGKRESRRVPVPVTAQHAIMQWWQALRVINPSPNDFFWYSTRGGGSITHMAFRQYIRSAALDAGITKRVSTHTMRKTFASRMYEAFDHDLRKTQLAMAHINVASTIRYLMGFEDEVTAAIQKLAIGGQFNEKHDQLELFSNVVRFSDPARIG